MKVYELMNKVNVQKIGVRLCTTEELAKDRTYENSTIMYWGSLDDMPAEYASYKIVSSSIKSGMLFCWCVEDTIKIKDILESDGTTLDNCNLTFYTYISKHDAYTKNHDHVVKVDSKHVHQKGFENTEVIDTCIYEDKADIYIFTDAVKSNIFDNEDVLEFYEI